MEEIGGVLIRPKITRKNSSSKPYIVSFRLKRPSTRERTANNGCSN